MHILAISNQKGGVGKTTTAVKVAIGLARHDKRTLLVDLDAQANATYAVLSRQEPGPTVYHSLIGKTPVTEVIRPSDQEHLDVTESAKEALLNSQTSHSLGESGVHGQSALECRAIVSARNTGTGASSRTRTLPLRRDQGGDYTTAMASLPIEPARRRSCI